MGIRMIGMAIEINNSIVYYLKYYKFAAGLCIINVCGTYYIDA